ncbi:MAG: aminomethyl-transferring glycine dehydrogenase subunit GcvPB [archaeon]
MKTIFEISQPGRVAVELPKLDVPEYRFNLEERKNLFLPEVSEVDVVRHFTALSRRNFGVDNGFYPLGSCTMKYNPKINEDVARFPGFNMHPYAPTENVQGNLQLMLELQEYLKEITGMDKVTLQPAAGAHGELTGVMIMKSYFDEKGENRTKLLIPDSAHGTNPASGALCGYEIVQIKSNSDGEVDLTDLKEKMAEDVAGVMLTNPNTLGLFDRNVMKIAEIVHEKGGLFYCDGANLNAIMGVARPGDMGYDIIQLNLHKSFSTPHGCGGPGAGPVGVKKVLMEFLPAPIANKSGENYCMNYNIPKTIGRMKAFYGNFAVLVRAYTYIRALGDFGIKNAAENAVLNANYVRVKLMQHYVLPYKRICQHEFVLSDEDMPNGITTADIAKRLLDYGFHPPTIYFPMIVHGAIMIEPNETESKETMDAFIDAMIKIKEEAKSNPEIVRKAPITTPVSRLDNVKAARTPKLCYCSC